MILSLKTQLFGKIWKEIIWIYLYSHEYLGVDIALFHGFVGDEKFWLSKHLLRHTPVLICQFKKNIQLKYPLTRAIWYVECTFGILSNKWHIFHRPIDVNINFAVNIVTCYCVLHNFVRDRDGFDFEEPRIVENYMESPRRNRFCDALSNYFESNQKQLHW